MDEFFPLFMASINRTVGLSEGSRLLLYAYFAVCSMSGLDLAWIGLHSFSWSRFF